MFMGIPQGRDADGRKLMRMPNPRRNEVPPLDKPPRCPNNLFALMTRCWAIDPAQRPTFHQIYADLGNVDVAYGGAPRLF
jgi:hypothetical protein